MWLVKAVEVRFVIVWYVSLGWALVRQLRYGMSGRVGVRHGKAVEVIRW